MKSQITKLSILFFTLVLASCSPKSNSPTKSEQKPTNELPKEFSLQNFIGEPLTNYPSLAPSNGVFAEKAFEQIEQYVGKKLPVYKIESNDKAIDSAVTKFQTLLGIGYTKTQENKGDQILDVYQKGNRVLTVNKQTSRVKYVDLDKFHKGEGVDSLDRRFILENAQKYFEKYLPKDLLGKTYFYRFYDYHNSETLDGKNITTHSYEGAVALNTSINGIPIIGSGGKYSLHIKPDGSLASADLQFAGLSSSNTASNQDSSLPGIIDTVKIFDSQKAMQILAQKMKEDEISLENHEIQRKEFGYFFSSKNGPVKFLVPTYAFFVIPKKGTMDKKRIYTFPASEDDFAIKAEKENNDLEQKRKSLKMDEESNTPSPREPNKNQPLPNLG